MSLYLKISFISILIFTVNIFSQINYQELHESALVVDLHNDALYAQIEGQVMEIEHKYGQFDLVRMQRGGMDVQFFAIWSNPRKIKNISLYDQAVTMIDSFDAIVQRQKSLMELARSPQDIIDITSTGKTAACLGLEGGGALDNDLNKIDYFFNRGVRYIGLTWNNSIDWASSAKDESNPNWKGDKGLGKFGQQVLERMNKQGMIIDISHAGEQTFYDVIEHSNKPVIASHSSVYSLCPHYRNLKDDQIKALANKGGVIFINFYPGYLVKGFDKIYKNARKQANVIEDSLKALDDPPEFNRAEYIHQQIDSLYPNYGAIVDHIEYVINLVGEDNVGLGSDFCGISIPPIGLENVSKFSNITRELVRRGHDENTIKKILGGNFMRVFKEISKK